MIRHLALALALALALFASVAGAQNRMPDVRYVPNGHERHVLDIYTPVKPARDLPVMFWIHGGGWQAGDKSDVALKPKVLTERGFVFVSPNYRLLPDATMDELTADIAASFGWVYKHIAQYGGDPDRIFVGGHSAGAQLAALLCTDDGIAKSVGVPFSVLQGCIPVDGDTYDIPKIIMTAELRQLLYQGTSPTFGHRQKFGNDPAKHREFSPITHVKQGKGIPPFLLLYFAGNADTRAQAEILESALLRNGVQAKAFGKRDTNHSRLNDELGEPDDPATEEFFKFLDPLIEKR